VQPKTPANPYKKRAAANFPLQTPENPYKKRSVPAAAIHKAAQSLLGLHDSETPLKPTHFSVITPSPVAISANSFISSRKPCLRQMLLDFRTSMSDNRGRGSHIPANVITTIVDTIPVPRTVHELSLVKHVGKALMNKHGSSILKICIQYIKDVKSWETVNNPMNSTANALFKLESSSVSPMISITPSTYLEFLRPPLPEGPVKDLFNSACKQALNEYNIQGNVSPSSIRPIRNIPTSSSSQSVQSLSMPAEYTVSPLNSRRASIEDLMLVQPGCALQLLLVPTHYKTKKKGTPMSPIVDNFCHQQGITNYSDYPIDFVQVVSMNAPISLVCPTNLCNLICPKSQEGG
jgi:hypothetical protein